MSIPKLLISIAWKHFPLKTHQFFKATNRKPHNGGACTCIHVYGFFVVEMLSFLYSVYSKNVWHDCLRCFFPIYQFDEKKPHKIIMVSEFSQIGEERSKQWNAVIWQNGQMVTVGVLLNGKKVESNQSVIR